MENNHTNSSNNWPYIVIIILLIVLSWLAFLVGKNYDTIFSNKKEIVNITSTGSISTKNIPQDIWPKDQPSEIIVLWDARCSDCQTTQILKELKTVPFLTWSTFKEVDYMSTEGKKIYKENTLTNLPAFLFKTNSYSDPWFVQYLEKTAWGLYSLNVWSQFDPNWEICDNSTDDNGDWKVDCEDAKCSKDFKCSPKVDRPVADLYIMSYCPYWLQAQKWYLEVMSKLSKVADINVKWVPYIMHGQKEADENVVQYCIQKEQKDKYLPYLQCFLKEDNKNEACRKEVKINETKLRACIKDTKTKFKVDEKMTDKSKQFPDFDIDRETATLAWVQWSPSFIVNGVLVDKIWRDAKSYAEAICSTFKTKPKACEQDFQNISFDPNFWLTSNWNTADAWCGK